MADATMGHDAASPGQLLHLARAGDESARGRLLDLYRNYLRLIARSLLRGPLRLRLDPSDLVQETYLRAHRHFVGFAGGSEPELVAWLRRILTRTLAEQARRHRRDLRDLGRERSLDAMLERSGLELHRALADSVASPSVQADRREQAVRLADAVARLPAHYREVYVLRTLEHVPFDQIAPRIGRSAGAARMLWMRALEQLRSLLEESP
jgi:RNA polymerase sigma-70 factor (ECF subfamily)